MCLHNSIAVAVAALYNQIDIVVAADDVAAADVAAHEYIAEIRKGIDVVVDKTSVVAYSERTSVAPSLKRRRPWRVIFIRRILRLFIAGKLTTTSGSTTTNTTNITTFTTTRFRRTSRFRS